MNSANLLRFFDDHRSRSDPLVLATVYETKGSTYSKAGALMLINQNGVFRGMLSGGCLEGDVAVRAQMVLESGHAQAVTYDLATDHDELWGLGVGCDGLMRIFLQPVLPKSHYAPFAAIAEVLRGTARAVVATIIEASSAAPLGATVVVAEDETQAFGVSGDLAGALETAARAVFAASGSQSSRIVDGDNDFLVLCTTVEPPPQILVLGAGLDAEPLVKFADELGWRCTIVDHRPAYIDAGNFSRTQAAHCIAVDELSTTIDLSPFDFAIVMSHHYISDRSYLRQLADTDIRYIGLLGPASRCERLLSELGPAAEKIRDRLHGPAGLDIGGRGPEPIALSIIAQMQEVLASN